MRIPLDHQSRVPLYRQIESYLRTNILSRALAAETRLPSSRELAQELGVSRITVKNAYANLESEGLVLTREGSGTYVAEVSMTPAADHAAEDGWPLWQQEAANEAVFSKAIYQPMPGYQSLGEALIRFTGVGDPRHFPLRDFLKAIQAVIRRDGVEALDYGEFSSGFGPLRETIAHVLASQGIQTHPDRVLITSGSQQALALVCQALLS